MGENVLQRHLGMHRLPTLSANRRHVILVLTDRQPPFLPASIAPSEENRCAFPLACAAFPPRLANSNRASTDNAAKPRFGVSFIFHLRPTYRHSRVFWMQS